MQQQFHHPEGALNAPCLNSSSSRTLNAVNFCGSTPCIPKTCMLALEKPHWGSSGVPFMNNTTGEFATALSMAPLVSSDSHRTCAKRNCGTWERRKGVTSGRAKGWRKTCWVGNQFQEASICRVGRRTDLNAAFGTISKWEHRRLQRRVLCGKN